MGSQVEGLAEALGWPFESFVVRVREPWSWLAAHRQPLGLLRYGLQRKLAPPWPDILITCGRRSAAVSVAVRRAAGGGTFTVHVQDPRAPPRHFDLVVPPGHDELAGPNVLTTRAAPHRVTPGNARRRCGGMGIETRESERRRAAGRLDALAPLLHGRSSRNSRTVSRTSTGRLPSRLRGVRNRRRSPRSRPGCPTRGSGTGAATTPISACWRSPGISWSRRTRFR